MKEYVLRDHFDSSKTIIDYKKELNPEQLDVVLHAEGPSLVLAGAGSGKTRTITYRVAYLLEQGIAPENILLVTFTNKAAKEMTSRVEMLLKHYPTGLWAGTFHSVANRLLRIYASQIGFTQNFTILDQEDAASLLKVCVKEVNVDTGVRRFPSPSKLHAMVSYARNSGQCLTDVLENRYSSFAEFSSVIERIGEVYEQRKQGADAMDFDDLLLKFRELLTQPQIHERLGAQFQYILVDEYQDTNMVQAEIIRQLASVHRNVLVVGDDAQSIYSFRAAEIRNILGFPETYQNTKIFRLTTNYRSSPEILAVANASILKNKDQFQKELSAVRTSLDRPFLIPAANQQEEACYIAQRVLELREDGIPLSEMAVLFRAAFHSQALEFELMKRDIPYEYRGGLKFFERAHVKDVLSHLRVKLNVKDEIAWMRILGLQAGIGLVTAQKMIREIQEHVSLSELIKAMWDIPKRAQAGWNVLGRTLGNMIVEELPTDLIRSVIAGDYRDYLEAEYPDFMDRLDDLEQFALFAEGYSDLKTFLDEISLSSDYGSVREHGGNEDEEKMVLSTIHQAKGLEWDVVFVMHLIDGKFPNGAAMEERGGLEEERRLFYVATTRARKLLHCSYPITGGYDTLMLSQPSMFLQELPPCLFEPVRLKRSLSSHTWGDDHTPTIVLDDLGERTDTDVSDMSFLRDIDDL